MCYELNDIHEIEYDRTSEEPSLNFDIKEYQKEIFQSLGIPKNMLEGLDRPTSMSESILFVEMKK